MGVSGCKAGPALERLRADGTKMTKMVRQQTQQIGIRRKACGW